MSRQLLDRLGIPAEQRTTEHWEPISYDSLKSPKRELVRRRCKAVKLYVETTRPLDVICKDTQISDDELRRLVKRCFQLDSTGTPFGFSALLPNARLKTYTRQKREAEEASLPGMHAGKFHSLLLRYPELIKFIKNKALGKKTEFGPPERGALIKDVHRQFLKKLRKLGVKDYEYPFTVKSRGYDALRRYINSLSDGNFRQFSENRMLPRDRNVQGDPGTARRPISQRPYERVELDAHTEDTHLSIEIPTAEGLYVPVPMERLSLIAVIDCASRACLGYEIGFGRAYNSDDVDTALTNAIVPWKPRSLTIPDLAYPPGSGLPSGTIPDCAWRLWNLISLDNARTHFSLNTIDQLTKTTRCAVNFGKVATPAARIIIERFFGTLAGYLHRLPSTTGSHTRDHRRTRSEENAVKYGVRFEHMLEVMDVVVAEYNVTPHQGLPGQLSPLQYLKSSLAQGDLPRQVFEEDRASFSLSWMRIPLTIRGSLRSGKRPYVQYKNGIYTNAIIADTPSLIGEDVVGEVNRRDARTMRIYLQTGESLGIVEAVGVWGIYPHTLRQRELLTSRQVMRHLALENYDSYTDPMDAWLKHLGTKARSSKKFAAKYAEVVYTLSTNTPSQLTSKSQRPEARRTSGPEHSSSTPEFDPSSPEWLALSRTVTR